MNILLFSMPDSFEHMPPIAIRMPNGALTSLAGNVDPHHRSPRRTYCSFKIGSGRPSSGSWPNTSPIQSNKVEGSCISAWRTLFPI
jgi:hypothetical protein